MACQVINTVDITIIYHKYKKTVPIQGIDAMQEVSTDLDIGKNTGK